MNMLPAEARLAGPREPTDYERRIYGEGVKIHPVTSMPLEVGYGALPPDQQAVNHLNVLGDWANKSASLVRDFDASLADATTEGLKLHHLQKRRDAAAADLAALNARIATAAAALGVMRS